MDRKRVENGATSPIRMAVLTLLCAVFDFCSFPKNHFELNEEFAYIEVKLEVYINSFIIGVFRAYSVILTKQSNLKFTCRKKYDTSRNFNLDMNY